MDSPTLYLTSAHFQRWAFFKLHLYNCTLWTSSGIWMISIYAYILPCVHRFTYFPGTSHYMSSCGISFYLALVKATSCQPFWSLRLVYTADKQFGYRVPVQVIYSSVRLKDQPHKYFTLQWPWQVKFIPRDCWQMAIGPQYSDRCANIDICSVHRSRVLGEQPHNCPGHILRFNQRQTMLIV